MPTRLAQHLINKGLLRADRVEEALRRQTLAGGSLDTVLLEQGLISEAGMLQALAAIGSVRLVLPLINGGPKGPVNPEPMRVSMIRHGVTEINRRPGGAIRSIVPFR